MKERLEEILGNAKKEIESIKTFNDLLNLKSRFLGKKSEIKELMKFLPTLPLEERPDFGKQINDVMKKVESLLDAAEISLNEKDYHNTVKSSQFDYTMPGRPLQRGTLHPLTLIQEQIEDVMISMGFQIADGFDIEDEYHNFDALNHPPEHPARNLADTFYVKSNTVIYPPPSPQKSQSEIGTTGWGQNSLLLRTHTSPVQVRVMESFPPPIKIISIGRAYRNDRFDLTHSPVFHQCEGLVVDEGITFKDLKDTINILLKKLFGNDCKSRFRPHFFPFTEPSAEVDVTCFNCSGKGCPTCKYSGWIELFGAGMVHPNVFDMIGIDSEKYTGFAFGCGIDRIAMLKLHIPDIRLLFENDIRFLKQFSIRG